MNSSEYLIRFTRLAFILPRTRQFMMDRWYWYLVNWLKIKSTAATFSILFLLMFTICYYYCLSNDSAATFLGYTAASIAWYCCSGIKLLLVIGSRFYCYVYFSTARTYTLYYLSMSSNKQLGWRWFYTHMGFWFTHTRSLVFGFEFVFKGI